MKLLPTSIRKRSIGCGISLVLCQATWGCGGHTPESRHDFRFPNAVILSARDDVAQTPPSVAAEVIPVNVKVDCTQSLPGDSKALQTALADTPLSAGGPETNATHPDADGTDWLLWGCLDGPRLPVALVYPAAMPATPPCTYAAGTAVSKTVCIVNHAPQKMQVQVRTYLPRGIYTVERLIVKPPLDKAVPAVEGRDGNAPGNVQAASDVKSASPETNVAFHLERLEGRDLKRAGAVVKSGPLESGQVVFYRYTDQSKIIAEAFADTYRRLNALESSHPGPAHRLRRMLREGDPYRSGIRSGDLSSRLESIQHLLLVVRQAQSLHHNYQNRGNVNGEAGDALMGSLERLMDGLCEASATLLGLVPQVSVEPAHLAAKSAEGASQTTSNGDDAIWIVRVALSNGGEHSVENVKLGLDNSELPSGIACYPTDPAFFGALRPGQSVHATFRLRCRQGVAVVKRLCVADVCYHAGGGPAHLRPRPW